MSCCFAAGHRRRMYTEEKAKVVAAAWGAELLKFLAALAMLHQDDWMNRMKCTIILLFQSSWSKIAIRGKELINSVPQAAATTFAFSSV